MRYRAEQQITDTWEARERVVVAITGGKESEMLIRRARRIATRAGADPHALTKYRKLADDATFHTVVGDDVPTALLEFSRGVNATQLVVGTSRRSRFARVFSAGIGSTVVQESGAIDVHMVTHAATSSGWRARFASGPLKPSRLAWGWFLAVAGPALVTAAGASMRGSLNFSTTVIAYLLVTLVVAIVGGLGPAITAALLNALLLNFFFTEPFYTFTIDAQQNVLTFFAMIIVGVSTALVVDYAARRAAQAARARTEATLLASYVRTVLRNPFPLARLLEKAKENFGLTSVALLERVDTVVTPDVHLALRGRSLPASDRRVLEAAAGQALLALRQQRTAEQALETQRQASRTELCIVDHGRGLPCDTADRVFAPFQRLGDRTPGGVGLGLSVARASPRQWTARSPWRTRPVVASPW